MWFSGIRSRKKLAEAPVTVVSALSGYDLLSYLDKKANGTRQTVRNDDVDHFSGSIDAA